MVKSRSSIKNPPWGMLDRRIGKPVWRTKVLASWWAFCFSKSSPREVKKTKKYESTKLLGSETWRGE